MLGSVLRAGISEQNIDGVNAGCRGRRQVLEVGHVNAVFIVDLGRLGDPGPQRKLGLGYPQARAFALDSVANRSAFLTVHLYYGLLSRIMAY